jgi:hypothetical protein
VNEEANSKAQKRLVQWQNEVDEERRARPQQRQDDVEREENGDIDGNSDKQRPRQRQGM